MFPSIQNVHSVSIFSNGNVVVHLVPSKYSYVMGEDVHVGNISSHDVGEYISWIEQTDKLIEDYR